MAEPRLTAKRITSFLQQLESLVDSLPTQERKEEIERELECVIGFLNDFKARLTALPTTEDEARLQESLRVLRHFVAVAEADPLISKTLGLHPKAQRLRSSTGRPQERPDVTTMVDELKGAPPAEVRQVLTRKENGCTVADLKQIAAAMGVRVPSKATRTAIVDQIVNRTEKEAGYALLRAHA